MRNKKLILNIVEIISNKSLMLKNHQHQHVKVMEIQLLPQELDVLHRIIRLYLPKLACVIFKQLMPYLVECKLIKIYLI